MSKGFLIALSNDHSELTPIVPFTYEQIKLLPIEVRLYKYYDKQNKLILTLIILHNNYIA